MAKTGLSRYKKVYRLLYGTYGKNGYVRLSFFLALVSRASKFVALPIVASQLIGSLATQDYDEARMQVLVFAAFSAVIGILSPVIKYLALLGENDIYAGSMIGYFDALLSKDVRYFSESMTGYLTTASRQYSDNTLGLVRRLRDSYLGTVFSMTIPIIVIAFVDITLGLIVLILSCVQAVYLLWASHKLAPYRTKSREMYKYLSGLISDAITNIVAIKSTAQEKTISKTVGDNMFKESHLFMAKYKAQAKLIALREVITVAFFLTLFWVTVDRISTGAIDVVGAVLIITYSFTILSGIYDLSDALDEHDDLVDKIIPMFDLLAEPNTVTDPANPVKMKNIKGIISFNNVSFAYKEGDDNIPIFNNLNLLIPAGQKLGIVGLSGAGKSTLAKLILRFDDLQDGEITIDGIPISKVRQSELRKNIAYVPQEPLLFHDTIAENIKLAKLTATDKEVSQAAKAANAYHFIHALPQGYNSVVGERGVKLSGGQKQRIAIARAVLQDAPIMLLDEATSALDSESEQIIKQSFAKILKDKTAIVIAHRLSTLSDMDRIVLLHEGVIIEDGTHKELLEEEGVYARLWQRQRQHPEVLEFSDTELSKI